MKKSLGILMALLLGLSSVAGYAKTSRHSAKHKPFAVLAPSRASLLLQNEMINTMGLERIGDERRLSYLVETERLVALPNSNTVRIAPSLPSNRRYVLPMVNSFLVKLASEYYAEFHQPLIVDSAVRSVTVQKWLRRHNASAAPIHGDTASSHEAGTTIDLSRRMTRQQTKWMEWRLFYYQEALKMVLVEEERNCYHIMVIREAK